MPLLRKLCSSVYSSPPADLRAARITNRAAIWLKNMNAQKGEWLKKGKYIYMSHTEYIISNMPIGFERYIARLYENYKQYHLV